MVKVIPIHGAYPEYIREAKPVQYVDVFRKNV